MDSVSLRQVSVRVLRFSSVTTIPVLHTHSYDLSESERGSILQLKDFIKFHKKSVF